MKDLAIEKALKTEIKCILVHNKKLNVKWCDLSDKKRYKKGETHC